MRHRTTASSSSGGGGAQLSPLAVHAYADGGSRGNPGPGAAGWLLTTPAGHPLQEGGEALGVCTSNVAEYAAARRAAEAARQAGAGGLVLHMDSRLVVEQLTRALGLGRGWATSAPHLVPYQERFRRAVAGFLPGERGTPPRRGRQTPDHARPDVIHATAETGGTRVETSANVGPAVS